MPELPEVETVRRDLRTALRGKKIDHVDVRLPKIVRGTARQFTHQLTGQVVRTIRRRGKLLIVHFADRDRFLLIHLKMTGQLIYRRRRTRLAGGHSWPPVAELPNKYSHVIVHFTDGGTLYFNDLRQFGYLALVNDADRQAAESAFGIEPLTAAFTREHLAGILRGRRTAIKNVLLDQRTIAGLGNIYVDEACFFAGVRPTRRASSLKDPEITKLHRGIVHVLQQSLKKRGTTFNNYRDGRGRTGNFVRRLKVYGRAGQPCRRLVCRRAGATIQKTKVNGRGTSYCPRCQR